MNIFIREIKANFRTLLIWSGIVALFVWIGFSKFSAYADNPEMLAILDSMPPALLEAFQFNAFNLTTLTGFFGVMFNYFALTLSVAAVMWGSDIITKEERDRTVEFSLTLPIRRSRLVSAKILAALVNCVLLVLVTSAAVWLSAQTYQPEAAFYAFMRQGMLALFFIQLIFLAVGIFLGCAMKQHKRASSVAVSILMVTYFLSIISGLQENLEPLKYFTPFKYFNPADLLQQAKFDPGFVGLAGALITVLIAGAYYAYQRRDLYI